MNCPIFRYVRSENKQKKCHDYSCIDETNTYFLSVFIWLAMKPSMPLILNSVLEVYTLENSHQQHEEKGHFSRGIPQIPSNFPN
jgi:hypothetical protein